MPAEVFSLHGHGAASLDSVKPQKKRVLKYEKGAKRPVDENAPKKPLSAYFQWAADNRKKVAKGNDNLAEITKKLGEMWRNLAADKKSKYETKAKKEQEAYKRLMAAYKLTSKFKDHEQKLQEYQIMMTLKPFRKDENMPKRALSAYMLFQQEKRPSIVEANPDAKVTEIMKLCAAAWKELSEKDKEPYVKKSKKASEKHAKDLEKYKTSKKHQQYLAEKKEYEAKMKVKRENLQKKKEKSAAVTGAGSGASPNPKRRRTAPEEKPKKKTSEPKKKTSEPKKKASEPKKKASEPKKKKSEPKKKKSEPKTKKAASKPKAKKASPKKKTPAKKAGKSKKAVKEPARSAKKKAQRAVKKSSKAAKSSKK